MRRGCRATRAHNDLAGTRVEGGTELLRPCGREVRGIEVVQGDEKFGSVGQRFAVDDDAAKMDVPVQKYNAICAEDKAGIGTVEVIQGSNRNRQTIRLQRISSAA